MQEQIKLNIKYIVAAAIGIFLIAGLMMFAKDTERTPVISTTSSKIQVVASFYPLYFFTKEVGGNLVDVINMTPSGSEPHDYEPTTQDIVKIQNSKIVVLNGGGLEAWGDKVAQIINTENTLVLSVGTDVMTQTMNTEGSMRTDPHVWLSPQLAVKMVDSITAALTQVDGVNASYYEANAQVIKDKLIALDTEFTQGLASCAKKDIVTSHSAFGYLASSYGLNQVSIAGLSPEAEPSPRQLAGIVDLAKKNNIKYIFFESLTSPKLSETIANEVGARTLVLNPIEGLTPDEIAEGKDYLSAMRENLKNLQLALECTN